jgi:hypothetical protein
MSVENVSVNEAPPSANASTVRGGRLSATIRYSDRTDVAETFVDSIINVLVDAQLMRIEFGITRLDEMKPNSPITGRRYPACRIVLSSAAALDLMNRLRQVATALAQAPKAAPPQPESEPRKPDYDGPSIFEQAPNQAMYSE